MAVIIDTFYSEQYLEGTRPSNPSFPVGSPDPVLNPPGTGGAVADNFVTLDTEQTITGEKTFDAKTIIGDPSVDYLIWDKVSKTFSIFTQAQFIHKYRGGAAGALNIGQYDVDGNASINNTSNGLLSLGTNNISRVEIEADGDVLLKKVDSGTGETLMIEPSGRVVKGAGSLPSIPEGRIPFGDVDGSLTTLAGLNYDTITNSLSAPDILSVKKILVGYQVGGNISGSALPSIQSENSTFTLVGNTTFNPQNFLSNANYRILLKQDAVGLRIITWPSSFLWEDGITPVLSTSPNAVDLLIINVIDSGKYCRIYKNFQ